MSESDRSNQHFHRTQRNFFPGDKKAIIKELGKEDVVKNLRRMMHIRNFEVRAESGYQQGFIGGFFHSYIGQEAVQVAALAAMGANNWWITTYRCHGMALLLGVSPNDIMAELYGRKNGNAMGRGGSMHLYADRLLGGFGIVGGQIPIATGAAFTIKYLDIKDEVAICFLGDGAVAQGAFHEALNLASLWDLPCIFVIENNHWGMGTAVNRAICVDRLAKDKADGYGMNGYTFNGMDFFDCYAGFKHVYEEVLKSHRPVLIEAVTERFRGHSISDPAFYRSKEDLQKIMEDGPIIRMKNDLFEAKLLDDKKYKEMDKQLRQEMIDAMKYAEESPWPDLVELEEDVFKE